MIANVFACYVSFRVDMRNGTYCETILDVTNTSDVFRPAPKEDEGLTKRYLYTICEEDNKVSDNTPGEIILSYGDADISHDHIRKYVGYNSNTTTEHETKTETMQPKLEPLISSEAVMLPDYFTAISGERSPFYKKLRKDSFLTMEQEVQTEDQPTFHCQKCVLYQQEISDLLEQIDIAEREISHLTDKVKKHNVIEADITTDGNRLHHYSNSLSWMLNSFLTLPKYLLGLWKQ